MITTPLFIFRENFLLRETPQVILDPMTPVSSLYRIGAPRKRAARQTDTQILSIIYIDWWRSLFLKNIFIKYCVKNLPNQCALDIKTNKLKFFPKKNIGGISFSFDNYATVHFLVKFFSEGTPSGHPGSNDTRFMSVRPPGAESIKGQTHRCTE
jgi:hypothetical protein